MLRSLNGTNIMKCEQCNPEKAGFSGGCVALVGADFVRQVPAYHRLDLRLAYRFNGKKVAGVVNLDVQNTLNRLNPSRVEYDAVRNETYVV